VKQICKHILLLSAVISVSAVLAGSQDSPSMGDVARQARQQKQNKETQGKAAPADKSAKVITNDEIPEHPEAGEETSPSPGQSAASAASDGAKMSAEQWKAQIRAQKDVVASMQSNIEKVNDSIQFAPGNCVRGCVQ